jgi:hypothetical protein
MLEHLGSANVTDDHSLVERQAFQPACYKTHYLKRLGSGNPRQWYLHKQISVSA